MLEHIRCIDSSQFLTLFTSADVEAQSALMQALGLSMTAEHIEVADAWADNPRAQPMAAFTLQMWDVASDDLRDALLGRVTANLSKGGKKNG